MLQFKSKSCLLVEFSLTQSPVVYSGHHLIGQGPPHIVAVPLLCPKITDWITSHCKISPHRNIQINIWLHIWALWLQPSWHIKLPIAVLDSIWDIICACECPAMKHTDTHTQMNWSPSWRRKELTSLGWGEYLHAPFCLGKGVVKGYDTWAWMTD